MRFSGAAAVLFCNAWDVTLHQTRMEFFRVKGNHLLLAVAAAATLFVSSCNIVKKESKTATLLKTENAKQADLVKEVNRFARVDSMRAKMDLKFEDNSFAEFGMKESYRAANGEIVVQRPGMILLKVQAPFIGTDIAQMSSDGQQFRVAILNDGGSGKYKKFVKGTNKADYSKLQSSLGTGTDGKVNGKGEKESVNAFANLRPQHFTDAMLVRPTDPAHVYSTSSIFQVEEDTTVDSKSPLRKVTRGYYFLDEFEKLDDGALRISRRFWFDRVGGIRLARQQIFDTAGEIESDIVYGKEGSLTSTGNYANLPLEIQVTRPKERYAMKLTYQTPEAVMIGNKFSDSVFVLKNSWNLEEVDLDKKLAEREPTSSLDKIAVKKYQ